jgi:hypothetical protein
MDAGWSYKPVYKQSVNQKTQWPKEKRTKGQTTIYKIPNIKPKLEQQEPH